MILSAERPEGHTGDWWQLDPGVQSPARCASARATGSTRSTPASRSTGSTTRGADMTPEEFARRFSDLPEWIEGMIHFDMHLVRYYLEHHGINVLLRSQWIQQGGGLAAKQAYYDGIHEIADDEALVVEFPVPDRVPLLADPRRRRPLLHRRLGQPPVEPQRRAGARRRRRLVPRSRVEARPRRLQLARQGRLPMGHPPGALLPGQRVPRGDGDQGAGR